MSLPRLWAVFSLVLVAVTHNLWFGSEYPAISLVALPWADSLALRWLSSLVLVAALLLVARASMRLQKSWLLVSAALWVSFLLDQHRMQPWAYQMAIYGLIFAAIPSDSARRTLIPLVASIYIYSALGKFDYQFAHTVGQDFLSAATKLFGGIPNHFDLPSRAKLAMLFPSFELLAGVGLLLKPTRKIAGVMVIAMHLGLISLLGPWSLDHSTGVLVWNFALMVQAYILFVKGERDTRREQSTVPTLVWALVFAVMIAPASERFGYWDHWTSWALYAPHTSRVEIEVHKSAIDQLDPELQQVAAEGEGGWRRLSIGRWSLDQRGVPVYPQGRYQLGLAMQIADQAGLKQEIRATLRGVADRWTGKRETTRMLGRDEIQRELARYWLTAVEPR
ncbi:MAG: hypothetical protein AB8B91_03725 [Rubripirellula sp.]